MRLGIVAFLVGMTGAAGVAHAGCSVTGTTLNFGQVNPTTGVTLLPVGGTINVTCSLLESFSVGLDDGLHASGTTRRMKNATSANFLTYQLYKDLLQTNRFGNAVISERATGAGLGLIATPILLFGTIPANQSAARGAYADTVTITVYY